MAAEDEDLPISYLLYVVAAILVIAAGAVSAIVLLFR